MYEGVGGCEGTVFRDTVRANEVGEHVRCRGWGCWWGVRMVGTSRNEGERRIEGGAVSYCLA